MDINVIKAYLASVISIVAGYFFPIRDILTAILIVLGVNFCVGLITGIGVNKEKWDTKKAWHSFKEAFVYFAIIVFVFIIGDKIHNQTGALQCISAITYALIYFYSVKIFKNLKLLFPDSRLIAFIYYVISIEFVKKIPYLQDFQKKEESK